MLSGNSFEEGKVYHLLVVGGVAILMHRIRTRVTYDVTLSRVQSWTTLAPSGCSPLIPFLGNLQMLSHGWRGTSLYPRIG